MVSDSVAAKRALVVGGTVLVLAALFAPGYFLHLPPRPDDGAVSVFGHTSTIVDAHTGASVETWSYTRGAWLLQAVVVGLIAAIVVYAASRARLLD